MKRTMALVLMAAFCGVAGHCTLATAGDADNVYPLNTCPVTGEKLGEKGAPVVKEYDGREIRFCCEGCPAKFEADKAKYMKQVDEAIVKQQAPIYPLDTCVVMGDKLPAKPIDYVYKNRLIRLCCNGCVADVKKDPGKYIGALDEAVVKKQESAYPLKLCVVCGKDLGADAKNVIIGGRLVRVESTACADAVKKDPAKYLEKLDAAAPKTAAPKAK